MNSLFLGPMAGGNKKVPWNEEKGCRPEEYGVVQRDHC